MIRFGDLVINSIRDRFGLPPGAVFFFYQVKPVDIQFACLFHEIFCYIKMLCKRPNLSNSVIQRSL